MIIVSSAEQKFINAKLKDLKGLFSKVYSAASDFNLKHKDETVFKKVLQDFNIEPHELAHIGDERDYDINCARPLGIHAFLLCRKKSSYADVHDLHSFKEKVLAIK